MLRCEGGSLYTGVTTDLARRFSEHASGRGGHGARYTAARPPVRFERAWSAPDRASAQRLEYRIKALGRADKEWLILGGDAGLDLSDYAPAKITEDGRLVKMLFVCYPKCSTCKKAREWLISRGAAYSERDIKLDNPTEAELREWRALSGLPLKRFFNTSGLKYKELGLAARLAELTEDEQFALLTSDGMLVKRPILVGEDFALVGFKQAEWEARV